MGLFGSKKTGKNAKENKKENECQPFGFEKDQMADFLCQEVSI